MIGLEKAIIHILTVAILLMSALILLTCISYHIKPETIFTINGIDIKFEGLTYGDLQQLNLQPNSVFIIVDNDEQQDITSCDYDGTDYIKSITAIVKNVNSICDFSIYNIHIGDSGDIVESKMPKETKHVLDNTTNVRISKYNDKDDNVIIIGTDMELNIVSYITIRIKE